MDNKYRTLRKQTGLSMQKFGDKYGIPMPTVRAWELGVQEPRDWAFALLERAVKEDLGIIPVPPASLPDPDVDQLKELCDALIELIRKYEVE